MTEEVSVLDLETEFIKVNKEMFQLIQTTSEGANNVELLNSIKKRKNDITEIIEKVTSKIPQNYSCHSMLNDIEKLSDNIKQYNSLIEKFTEETNEKKRANFKKLCEITNDFLL